MAIRDLLGPTQDQRALHDSVHGFLAEQHSSGQLHGALDSQPGYNSDLHARLTSELGLAGLTIPEELGGLGLSQAEACVIHTELGRVLYPGPLLCCGLAATALLTASERDAREHWLPLVVNGSVTATVAAADEAGQWSPGPDGVRAEQVRGDGEAGGGWRLWGRRWYVIAAHVAGIVVIPATIESGLAMFLVESGSSGLTAFRQLSLDLTRRTSIVTLDATPALLLTQDAAAVETLARVEQEYLLATAAEAAGGIGWCLDATIAYAQEREQSGYPSGSFQAVANSCVDILAELQHVSAAVHYAAAAAATGAADAPQAARAAALQAAASYRAATEAAIQLLGHIGFTQEHDANLHYRRAWSTQQLVGGPLADRAAAALADP